MTIDQNKGMKINYPIVIATKEPIDRRSVIENSSQLGELNTTYEGMVTYIKSLDRLFLIDSQTGDKKEIITETQYESLLSVITELTKKVGGYISDNIIKNNCIIDSLYINDNVTTDAGFVSGTIFF